MLFNEPKLLKSEVGSDLLAKTHIRFSALQRAEIAEIDPVLAARWVYVSFSALQRAEIAEIETALSVLRGLFGFSALQRAEIAEIVPRQLSV